MFFLVCLSVPVQGELSGLTHSSSIHFADFLPEGTQFPSGTIIGDNTCPDEPRFKLTGGTSEIVSTNLFREGGSLALQLDGTLEKLSFYSTPPLRSLYFARPTSDLSDFAGDFIESGGEAVSLFDLLSNPSNGELIAVLGWDYVFEQLDQGGYSLRLFPADSFDYTNHLSYSVSSQNPGLLVHYFAVGWIPEPSSLTLLFISVVFCRVNTRISRRLR